MLLQELESRLDHAFTELEQSFVQHHRYSQESYQALQRQLELSLQREAKLRENNAYLVSQLNNLDSSPDRNPLLHKIKIIRSYVDQLARDAAAFNQSCGI
ncbi:MbeD/MobD family mobilization/exclusion protein [Biostraticola tofi]|uniref:MbeD/MobD like protein n=1 Tax=Biostraticola tofi TaxID=466109 RepID=A0A4R3Z1E7_9GAMM|nr:MbeD/MobD family mobilization/exclusion protein [Biostraticola tofi]TCV98815.1 MbeD/MobD like protein [Biostraticola tofi]